MTTQEQIDFIRAAVGMKPRVKRERVTCPVCKRRVRALVKPGIINRGRRCSLHYVGPRRDDLICGGWKQVCKEDADYEFAMGDLGKHAPFNLNG
jgi:hypothetical protein